MKSLNTTRENMTEKYKYTLVKDISKTIFDHTRYAKIIFTHIYHNMSVDTVHSVKCVCHRVAYHMFMHHLNPIKNRTNSPD